MARLFRGRVPALRPSLKSGSLRAASEPSTSGQGSLGRDPLSSWKALGCRRNLAVNDQVAIPHRWPGVNLDYSLRFEPNLNRSLSSARLFVLVPRPFPGDEHAVG